MGKPSPMQALVRRLIDRVKRVERTKAGLRQATVTGTSPLEVAFDGSSTSVAAIGVDGTELSVSDRVSVLVQANDFLVVGRNTDDPQTDLTGGPFQPLDSDLTAIAALSTTSFGRSLLELANGSAGRTALGLVIGTDVQAYDSDLAAIAALSTTSFGRSLLESANAAAARSTIGAAASSHTHAQSDVTNLTTDMAAKAPLASPALTGTPTAPTAATGTSTTQIATTAFTMSASQLAALGIRIKAPADHYSTALLTADANGRVASGGPTTIDGVAVAAGDRVLFNHASSKFHNSIWVHGGGGGYTRENGIEAYESGAWGLGAFVQVLKGNTNAGRAFYVTGFTDFTSGGSSWTGFTQTWTEWPMTPKNHQASHVPSGTDPLPTGTPVAVGTANSAGSADSFAKSDHVHAPPASESWIAVSGGVGFANSWTNFGSGYNDAAYYKDPLGVVHLRGLIKSGTVGSTAFTLPSGYRPPATSAFPVASNAAFGYLEIGSSGVVIPRSPSNNAWVTLEGITFRAA